MKKRAALTFILAFVLLFNLAGLGAQARWSNTGVITTVLWFQGTTAYVEVEVIGMSGSTQADLEVELWKLSGTTYTLVKTWYGYAATDYLRINQTQENCTSGAQYWLEVYSGVYRYGSWEDVHIASPKRTCP